MKIIEVTEKLMIKKVFLKDSINIYELINALKHGDEKLNGMKLGKFCHRALERRLQNRAKAW